MKDGSHIYEHTDGRWEARYRKGRRTDGSILYGSVYGRSYEEAEKKRAEILRELARKADAGESDDALAVSEDNKKLRLYYTPKHYRTLAWQEPLTERQTAEIVPYIKGLREGFRLAVCLALYMGVSGEELAALRYSDIDLKSNTLTVCRTMLDAKHMFGTVVPCEVRELPIPKSVGDFVYLSELVRRGGEKYILTEDGEAVKSVRTSRLLWIKLFAEAGCPYRVTPELLRATFICGLLGKGVNFKTIAAFTGLPYTSLQTRYGQYAAVNTELVRLMDDTVQEEDTAVRQMNLLIIGAGSHGHAVYELADKLGVFQKICFLDDKKTGDNIIGTTEDIPMLKNEFPLCFIAVGNNEERRRLAEAVTKAGFIVPKLVSGETSIARGVSIGRGTIIMPQATVNTGAVIGDFCIIASNALIGFNATIGSYAHCDCASVVMKGCTVPPMTTVDGGEIVRTGEKA